MRIQQVSPTHRDNCGIGNFSRNLEAALITAGADLVTTTDLIPAKACDVIVIQHEWGLFSNETALHSYCFDSHIPVVLFAHSGGVDRFAEIVAGFIAMHEGIVRCLERPSLVMPHPAWTPAILDERPELLRRFGLQDKSLLVGSSGFMTGYRQFPEIVSCLMPALRDIDVSVQLTVSHVGSPWHSESRRIAADLDELRREYKGRFNFVSRFLSSEELNTRLQACDVLWCYTNRASSPYASGVAADQYASGTAMVVAAVDQHRDVLGKQGVIPAPSDFHGFVSALIQAVHSGRFPRRPPSAFPWTEAAQRVLEFLTGLLDDWRSQSQGRLGYRGRGT